MTTERYRIAVFGRPRAPWRSSYEEALADAVALELASWDQSRREWFLAVPVDVQVRRALENPQGEPEPAPVHAIDHGTRSCKARQPEQPPSQAAA